MSNFTKITNTKLDEVKAKLTDLPSLISGFDTHNSKTSAEHLHDLNGSHTTLVNASVRDINNTDQIGDGSSNHTSVALGYDRSGGKGRALLVDGSGRLSVDINSGVPTKTDGSTGHSTPTGVGLIGFDSGTAHAVHCDSNGTLKVQNVASVYVLPANTVDGTHASQSKTVATQLFGRTDIADETTSVAVKVAADGTLQTSGSGGGGGGDATAANQSTMITHLSEIEGAVETIEGCVSGSELQVDIVSQPTPTHTFENQTTSVLAPIGGDTQRITEGANINLESTKEFSVVLVSSSADAQSDVQAQVEFSHDGTTFFTDHTGASTLWALSFDIQSSSRGIYIAEITGLEPMKPKAKFMRVIYNHVDNTGSDISVIARIVQHHI